MNREIVIDKNMFERNAHGSFGFPINLLHIVMSDYPFGRFNGHWHPEIEITYIADGEMQYQVNEVAYTLKRATVSLSTAMCSTPARLTRARIVSLSYSTSTPFSSPAMKIASSTKNTSRRF